MKSDSDYVIVKAKKPGRNSGMEDYTMSRAR